VAVEVQGPAHGVGGELLADGADGGGAAEHEADAGLAVRRPGGGHHGLGVLDGRGHRLLAEHVLAGGQQALDDPAVERVGHDHADHVDVVGGGHGLPAALGPLVAEAAGGVGGEGGVDVGDRGQADLGQALAVHRRGRPVPGGVRPAGHAGPDDGDADGRIGHGWSLLPGV
jgi:hypothetical protein